MIVITSISPTHVNAHAQPKAVQSWIGLGLKVYSLNSAAECNLLTLAYPDVEFIPTDRTMELTYGKPYVALSAIIDFAKAQDDNRVCIINSDIELRCSSDDLGRISDQMQKSIVLSNRVNHNGDYSGSQYVDGIDVFFIHKKFLSIYPQSMYCLGQCFWDYWIPFTAAKNGVEVVFLKQNISYHLNHHVQYSQDAWLKTGRYFLWENGLYQFNDTTGIPRMSRFVFDFIYNASERITV